MFQLNKTFTNIENLDFTDSVETAKEMLNKRKYNLICLDHDLNGRIFMDSNEPNTGYQLAKYLSENKSISYNKCIVHSLNYPAALKMIDIISNSIYLPAIMFEPNSIMAAYKK